MRLITKGIGVIVAVTCSQYAIADAARSSSYDSAKAVAYATAWALSKNSNYPDYTNGGGDCTNFASQVLHTGGWKYTTSRVSTDVASWYVSLNGKTFSNSQTWSVAEAFHRRLLIVPREKSARQIFSIEDLKLGDVVFMVKNSLAHHTMIVTKKVSTGFWFWKSTDTMVSYHNGAPYTPKLDVSLKDMVATNPTESFKFVRISP